MVCCLTLFAQTSARSAIQRLLLALRISPVSVCITCNTRGPRSLYAVHPWVVQNPTRDRQYMPAAFHKKWDEPPNCPEIGTRMPPNPTASGMSVLTTPQELLSLPIVALTR